MITYLRLLTLVFTFAFAFSALPQPTPPPALQEVEAKGTGITEDEAFKQAVVDAVRQAVGTLVTSENVVKNDKLIKDEILTFSNGFVEKVIKKETRNLDGVWEMKLTCMVRKGKLYDTLQLAKIPTVQIDGVSIAAKVMSDLERKKKGHALLVDSLDRFLVDYLSCFELKSGKPIVGSTGDEESEIEIPYKLAVNELNWNRTSKNLSSTLAAANLLDTDILKKFLTETGLRDGFGRGSYNRDREEQSFEVVLLTVIDFDDGSKKMFAKRIDDQLAPGLSAFTQSFLKKNNPRFNPQKFPFFNDSEPKSKNVVSINNTLFSKMKSASQHLAYRFRFNRRWWDGNYFSENAPFYLKGIAAGQFAHSRSRNFRALGECILLKSSLLDSHLKKTQQSNEHYFFWIPLNAITPRDDK